MIDLWAAFNWSVISAFLAFAAIVIVIWLARRERPRLGISIEHGDDPASEQPQPALILTIDNSGASTILRRGWVRWGPGIADVMWDLPVGELAVPGGGLFFGRGRSIAVAIGVTQIFDATKGAMPLEIGVEDRAGNTARIQIPDSFRALFGPSGGR